jgi:hypothetical protein
MVFSLQVATRSHNYQIAISLDIYLRMAKINNIREFLNVIHIDETGALVVTAIKTQEVEPIVVDENPAPAPLVVAINPRINR